MSQSNKERILQRLASIQAAAQEVRNLVEIEESSFDREWPTHQNFVGDDCWLWLCGDEDFGSPLKSAKALFAAMETAGPKVEDNE